METLEILTDTPEELHLKSSYRPTWQAWRKTTTAQYPLSTSLILFLVVVSMLLLAASVGLPQLVTQNQLLQIALTLLLLIGGLISFIPFGIGLRYWRYRQIWHDPIICQIRIDRVTHRLSFRLIHGEDKTEQFLDLDKAKIVEVALSYGRIYLRGWQEKQESETFIIDIVAPELRERVYAEITALIVSRGE
jgi:hypothetical protein